ncbi:UDP-N-acetylglucosamine 2-epimerase (non-hydrolyzing) [bacterium]|jgi:UDP-GlcNAc3NAcA epimerase|nr:UDP-N-acetylglucosamine 2-epimerase (non-hydrolyzing) [bacterium]
MNKKRKILTVVGARPQFIKSAIVSEALKKYEKDFFLEEVVVNTGQHYDKDMSDIFYNELRIKNPDYNLNIGPNNIYTQLSSIVRKLGDIVTKESPDVVLVYGDTTSTLAAATVSSILDVPLVHIESGERIYRRVGVPEETNRIITDHISTIALTSTKRAVSYLIREGFSPSRIKFVGDPMYDLFIKYNNNNNKSEFIQSFKYKQGAFHLATIHRVQNTNNKELLKSILDALDSSEIPVVLPLHPRVSKILKELRYFPKNNLEIIKPLSYIDFTYILRLCNKVFTDSGGVTREAFFARKPCIIPMENSWWSEVVESGWAIEVGTNSNKITNALNNFIPKNDYPEGLFGNGESSKKIAKALFDFVCKSDKDGAWHRHGYFHQLPKSSSTNFTYSEYEKTLKILIDEGYSFESFSDTQEMLDLGKRFVLMRHDIDLSLEKALMIAEIESKFRVTSTYFIMLRNDFYNIFSKQGTEIINNIVKFGHQIGLHFDCSAYPQNLTNKEFSQACLDECKVINEWFNINIEIISYHRPGKVVMSGDCSISHPLHHTYMPLYTNKISYKSDSRGKWGHGHPLESQAFKDRKPLHILTHPIWWNKRPIAPYQNLHKFIDDSNHLKEYYLSKNNTVYRVGERSQKINYDSKK